MNSLAWNTLSARQFLTDYWQKKPVLLNQAFPNFTSPLTVDEVAGLALEPEFESRLIWEKHPEHGSPWALQQGPFTEAQLQQLPSSGWSLLVQGVDHWVDAVAQFRRQFNFIPSWRFEDIMISLAPPGGSVGPHVDQYDVFLCQVEGERLWHWSETRKSNLLFREDTALSILDQPLPEPVCSALLSPGDILYLPPGYAHHGVAQSFSQTWSVGFRAPDAEEIMSVCAQRISLEAESQILRYADPDLTLAESEQQAISSESIMRTQHMLSQWIKNPEIIADVLGTLTTRQANHHEAWPSSPQQDPPHLNVQISWQLGVRKTHFGPRLYVNGASYFLPKEEMALVNTLMSLESLSWGELNQIAQTAQGLELMEVLWEQALLAPTESQETSES